MDFMFNEWYPAHQGNQSRFPEDEREVRIHPVETVLNPQEINAFLAMLQNTEDSLGTPLIFFRSLIQKSYGAGNNDFNLGEVDLSRERDLGRHLVGSDDKPLIIRASGVIGNALGADTKYVEFHMDGNVGTDCGYGTENSKFFINGYAERNFGCHCKDSYLDVRKTSLFPFFLDSERSTCRILEGYPSGEYYNVGLGSRDCKVISPDKELIKVIAKQFRTELGWNNRLGKSYYRDSGVRGNRFYHELPDKTLVEVSK